MDGASLGPCDVYYSCHVKEHKFDVPFVLGKRLRQQVLSFTPVDECAHALTKEKDDATKDSFYERLERSYERCPRHDIKIVLGDFNARMGKERIFSPTVRKLSLHNETSGNGQRLIDFAGARNMVVCSTRFQQKC